MNLRIRPSQPDSISSVDDGRFDEMVRESSSSIHVRTNIRKMTALLLLAVALAFVTVSVTDAASASEDYDQYIVYEDPEGGNPDVTVGYYGIAATEYNPEYWKNTGNVGNHANWTGPTGEPVTVNGFTVTIKSLGKKDNTYTINFPSNH